MDYLQVLQALHDNQVDPVASIEVVHSLGASYEEIRKLLNEGVYCEEDCQPCKRTYLEKTRKKLGL